MRIKGLMGVSSWGLLGTFAAARIYSLMRKYAGNMEAVRVTVQGFKKAAAGNAERFCRLGRGTKPGIRVLRSFGNAGYRFAQPSLHIIDIICRDYGMIHEQAKSSSRDKRRRSPGWARAIQRT